MIIEILDERILYFNPGLVLNNHAILVLFAKIDAMPEIKAGQLDIFADHSQVQRVELSSEHYREWALNRQEAAIKHQPYKVAIYSSEKLGFGMARMFESLFTTQEMPVSLKAFGQLDQALDWLGTPNLKENIISLGEQAAVPIAIASEGNTGA